MSSSAPPTALAPPTVATVAKKSIKVPTINKDRIATIESKLASKAYNANIKQWKTNKGWITTQRRLTKKHNSLRNNVNTSRRLNVLAEGLKNLKLKEVVTEAELDDEAEDAEVVGACVAEAGAGAAVDTYTKEILMEQYTLHKEYVERRKASALKLKIIVRLPHIPEDISENIIKFIIHKLGDKSSSWSCKSGDLESAREGVQECKCFTSTGPLSFSPSSKWGVIYFLDARDWLSDKFVLYRVNIKKEQKEWQELRMSKTQTFAQQMSQKRRPRIGWENLYPQITDFTTKVFEGTFDDIFSEAPALPVPMAEEVEGNEE